jgi:predicted nucleotidyltransferase
MSDAVDLAARDEVLRRLDSIERAEGVRILLAVESGSRAWGFHSPDSDYDARFIYARREDDYLALSAPRDVIETPIQRLFDVNGWDIAKALRLMMRGNSVVQEWLASPIVYRAEPAFVVALQPISRAWRSAYADAHHYHGLLATQRSRFIEGRDRVRLKKYFYAVRPAIALHWLRERGGSPPMDLPSLLAGVKLPVEAAEALEELRAAKALSSEVGEGPPIPALDAYIEAQAQWAILAKGRMPDPDPALVAETDAFFRSVVRGKLC